MTTIVLILIGWLAGTFIRQFLQQHISERKAMRQMQREANLQSWRDLGATKG